MYGAQIVFYPYAVQVGFCVSVEPFQLRIDLGLLGIEIGYLEENDDGQ